MNTRTTLHGLRALGLALIGGLVVSASAGAAGADIGDVIADVLEWPMFGQNLANTSSALIAGIDNRNVTRLTSKWVFTTHGDIVARAAVVGGSVYLPDFGGFLYRLDARTGLPQWSKNLVSDYGLTPAPGSTTVVSRTSPAVDGDTVYIGTQTTGAVGADSGGAYLLAVNTADGSLRWKTQLDAHPLSVDTTSPVVFKGVVYVGVASLEEGAAAKPAYPCCSFRGSAMAINAATGAVIWKAYTVPPGYTGGAVWSSTLVPDPLRGTVYVTTGNNYRTPTDAAFLACNNGSTSEAQVTNCLSSDDHIDSILALDLRDGSVRWSHRLSSADDWNVACTDGFSPGQANCPNPQGQDFDFGSGANLMVTRGPHGLRQIVGAGQKSGVYSAFDPDNGTLLWATQVGPGSTLGGIEWGSASDGRRIYVAISNMEQIPYAAGRAGSWSALDPTTGKILWQTPDPNGAMDLAPMTVANGVVYAASMAGAPQARNMFALNASTGAIEWSFASGGSVIAGASVVGDTIYWGSGYSQLAKQPFVGNDKFYAFSFNRN
jgi:polyvinyl alcohol dehydrogenase (cytochrome)